MEYITKNINDYSKEQIDNFYNMLPDFKKKKINNYKHYETKCKSIIGEIILKDLLLKHNVYYNNLEYFVNECGKPYIKNSNLYFNISHSFDYIITAISKKEIGIDIEKIRKTSLNTINYFATENEKIYILSSKDNIEERLFRIYTLKEAYFKMLGSNLNNILNVEFIIENDIVSCSDNSVKIGLKNDIKGYIIAFCEKK